ncbi:hypothetical protein HDU76_001049 [Blyttiomyces sp. JEL0837]|nr:hypothetical protein HDU76_001049 [Blyttiomyces sp. JEL0837]
MAASAIVDRLTTPLTCPTFRRDLDGCFLYCYGNSFPEDFFLHHPAADTINETNTELSALSLGCGDIRSLLYTLSERVRKSTHDSSSKTTTKFSFVLNDWQPEIIARNTVMLYALATDESLTPDLLLQFWYSMHMTEPAHEYWMAKVSQCININWTDQGLDSRKQKGKKATSSTSSTSSSCSFIRLHDIATETAVKTIWKKWPQCQYTKSQVRKLRDDNVMKQPSMGIPKLKNVQQFRESMATAHVAMLGNLFSKSKLAGSIKQEMMNIAKDGSLSFGEGQGQGGAGAGAGTNASVGTVINPSLFLILPNGDFAYGLHYGTLPYEGHRLDYEIGVKKSMLMNLERWIQCFREMTKKGSVKLISLGVGHALQFMDQLLIEQRSFDVIDTSNLADHVGMVNLLGTGSALLRQPQQSILTTCSFLLYHVASTREEYLDMVIGLPADAYSTLLGVELKMTDESSWQSQISQFAPANSRTIRLGERNVEFFHWRASLPTIRPVSIKGSPFLLDALKKCLLRTSVDSTLKYDGPGGVNTTPGAFSKMLALAFAQQRITYDDGCQVNKFPLPDPADVLSMIYSIPEMKGTMSDVYAFLNLYGFNIRSARYCDAPLFAQAVIDTPRHKNNATPVIFIEARGNGVGYTIESVDLVELPNNKVEISCYLPGFLKTWRKEDLTITVYTKIFRGQLPECWPAGRPINLSKMKVQECPFGACGHLIQGAMCNRPSLLVPRNPEEEPLQVGFVHQVSATEFQVKLVLADEKSKTATFKPVEDPVDGSFVGLYVGDVLMKIPLSTNVKLVNCKIHRKSGFLLVTFKKHFQPFPLDILSTKNLKPFSPNDVQQLTMAMGLMYTDDHRDVKDRTKSIDTLSKSGKTLFGFKDNLQVLFTMASDKKWILFTTKFNGLGIFGAMYIHGIYLHPAVNSMHLPTPMLDASWALFETVEEYSIVEKIRQGKVKELNIEEWEFEDFKSMLRFYEANSCDWDRGVGREIPKPVINVGGETSFKRCMMFPLYNASMKPLLDENSEERKAVRKLKDESMKMQRELKIQADGDGDFSKVPGHKALLDALKKDPEGLMEGLRKLKSMGVRDVDIGFDVVPELRDFFNRAG